MPELDRFDLEEEKKKQGPQPFYQPAPLSLPPAQAPSGGQQERLTIPPPTYQPQELPGAGGSGYSDIDELRADPYTTAFEQSALARSDERVGERYKSLRQQRTMELARRGITPDSPLFQREMSRIDTDQARESSGFRRGLELSRISERERRLGAARGIEYQLDQMERQRLADMLGMLSGNPDYMRAGADIGGNIAQIAATQAMGAQNNATSLFGGAGDLFGMLLGRNEARRRPPISIGFGGPSYGGPAYYEPPEGYWGQE